jgi:xanthine dehydrogenase YagS FAD-binding subunit
VIPFTYERALNVNAAMAAIGRNPDARFIAGGTNLLDLMKLQVERPTHLVDISRLPLAAIEDLPDGGLRIGAEVRNSDLAADSRVRQRYPALAQALLAGASPQLRNKASTGGNFLQRTRCYYFYDTSKPCNKREPGSGCSAIGGFNRMHAVLGASEQCIATHPSDMAVAMVALDAHLSVIGRAGERTLPADELYRLPGDNPELDTNLAPGELITSVDLPPPPGGRMTYRKVRDRASYAFALVSVAAVLDVSGGTIRGARVVFGGLAHKPWRSQDAEQVLIGGAGTPDVFNRAAEAALAGARGYGHNDFKIPLARRLLVRVLRDLANG